jgi:hypothetical protein
MQPYQNLRERALVGFLLFQRLRTERVRQQWPRIARKKQSRAAAQGGSNEDFTTWFA